LGVLLPPFVPAPHPQSPCILISICNQGRETDYLALKSNCLKLLEALNAINVKKSMGDGPGATSYK
jgi:hypothetical protein